MKKIINVAFAALLLSALSFAQRGPGRGFGPGAGPGLGPGFGPHFGKVVTGEPYSATVTNQRNETLQDGNTVQQTTTTQVARDSQGRTYEQTTLTGGPLGAQNGPKTLVFLSDPVAGYSYV